MESKLDVLNSILQGSKEYDFEYGDYGMTVLKLKGYYSGKQVKLDLGMLLELYPEIVEEIIIKEEE